MQVDYKSQIEKLQNEMVGKTLQFQDQINLRKQKQAELNEAVKLQR